MVQNESAIDNQVNSILRRAKEFVLILCNDAALLKKYRNGIKCVNDKLDLCVVVENPDEYSSTDLKFYKSDSLIKNSLMNEKIYNDYSARIIFAIFADYKEDIIIIKTGSSLEGFFSSDFLITEYLQKSIMDRIKHEQ